ncbi:MAG: DUF445 family protein [Cyanobacteria bacterium P01_G01_bin.19]
MSIQYTALALANLWIFFVPPVAGSIIGYFTNDIAIKMLFRPYKPIYIGKRKLPFTPGLIPSNQERLAQKVSDTIMGSLLTPGELQKLAQRLLAIERIESAISWLIRLALDQVKSDREQKTAKILGKILRDLFSQSLPRLVKVLARREDFLEAQINQIFDRILLNFKLKDSQGKQFADWLLTAVIPPDTLRRAIIDFLSDRNIQIIDEGFREKTSGTYWVVANLFGLSNSLVRLRSFCIDEPEITNARLQELTYSLQIRDRIKNWLTSLSLQNLPVSTVRQLRKTVRNAVRNYIKDEGGDVVARLGDSVEWENLAGIILKRLQSSPTVNDSLEVVSQELALILDRYLERDLEKLVAQAIPILSIDQVIIDRVTATSPEELEEAVQGIVKNELQAIVNLGGILGFIVGLLQVVILFFN